MARDREVGSYRVTIAEAQWVGIKTDKLGRRVLLSCLDRGVVIARVSPRALVGGDRIVGPVIASRQAERIGSVTEAYIGFHHGAVGVAALGCARHEHPRVTVPGTTRVSGRVQSLEVLGRGILGRLHRRVVVHENLKVCPQRADVAVGPAVAGCQVDRTRARDTAHVERD